MAEFSVVHHVPSQDLGTGKSNMSLEVVIWSNKKHTLNGQGHKNWYDLGTV